MEVSQKKGGSPKSSMFKGFSIINHPFGGNIIYIYIHTREIDGTSLGIECECNIMENFHEI